MRAPAARRLRPLHWLRRAFASAPAEAALARALFERMEPRILYSADAAAFAQAAGLDAPTQELRLQQDESAQQQPQRLEIVFVDLAVPDAQTLIAALEAQRDNGRTLEIVTIDSNQDGIDVVSRTLAGREQIDALHFITHGNEGVFNLGHALVDAQTLQARAGEIAPWGSALGADADLLLYGCDIAGDGNGQALVQGLAALTGADVAASTDLTGAAAAGGNWTLEYRTGHIDAAAAVDAAGQQTWTGTLAITVGGSSSAATSNAQPSLTFSHTVTAGANGLLVVQVVTAGGVDVSSVTYGGVALTRQAEADSNANEVHAEIWSLTAPVSGTANIVITAASSVRFVAGATHLHGVDQASPFSALYYDKGNDALPTITVPAAVGSMVIDVVGAVRVGSYTVGPDQTQNWTATQGTGNGDIWAVASREAGAASVTMSHAFTSVGGAADMWVSLAAVLRSANTSPPDITSNGGGGIASVNVSENTTAVTTVVATDPDGTTPTYRIASGLDGGHFTINPTTGVLTFASAPDFEAPTDSNGNNIYQVQVEAWDGDNATGQIINVTVTNTNEAPVITSNGGGASAAVSVVENTTAVTTVTATDPEGGAVFYSIVPGGDWTRFTINPFTGALRFWLPPDYELPLDGGADNVYNVTVRASDGFMARDQALSVSVTNVANVLTVTTTDDRLDGNTGSIELLVANPGADGLISLREAITATNNTAGADTIALAAGTYTIAIPGGDDNNNSGDFDIKDSLTLTGAGAASTVISGGDISRVFDIRSGTVNLAGLTIRNGFASSGGAGLEAQGGTIVSLNQVVVRNNTATGGDGAGIHNNGVMTLTEVEVRDNVASGGSSLGGGIYHRGNSLTLDRVTVAGNSAYRGGGIYANDVGMSLANVTISGNTASNSGGGLYFRDNASLLNVTVAGNNSALGGGLYLDGAGTAVTLRNVLLADNTGGPASGDGSVGSLGNNLSDVALPALSQPGDLVGVAANLGALAANGGFGRTHTLLSGSAALDAGNTAAAPATDQRNSARVGNADIGAYEAAATVNRAPVHTVPAALTVLEDAPTAIAGLSVADADNGGGVPLNELLDTTLSVSNGTLQVSLAGGATIISGANNSATLRLGGSEAAINAALATLVYRGSADYVGGDTLVIVSRDGAGLFDSDTVAITVNPVNDAPDGRDATLTVAANGSLALTRGDFGFADLPSEGHAFASVQVQLSSAGTLRLNGTALVAPAEVTVAQLDAGALVFVPAAGASGAAYAMLAFQVRDSGGVANGGVDLDPIANTLTFDVSIVATNTPPVVTSPDNASVPEGTTLVHTLTATDAEAQAVVFAIAGGPDMARFTIDGSNRLLFTAAPDREAPTDSNGDNVYLVQIRATDSAGDSVLQTVTIAVTNVNEPPTVAVPLPDQTVAQGTPFSFTFAGGTFADVDAGDTLTYSTGALPAWLSFNATTRTFSGTAGNADVGTATITVTATDASGAAVSDSFDLVVANTNDAPTVATPIADQAATQGTPFSFTFAGGTFADVDAGDTLTYSTGALPAWLSFDAATRTFSGTPTNADVGPISVRVSVTDSAGAIASDDFALTVGNTNDAPRFISHGGAAAATLNVSENTTATDTLAAIDDDANSSIVYAISGGADAAALRIDAQTGVLSFVAAPDFERPADADADGRYEVEISAGDGIATARQLLTIGVRNVEEAPTVLSHTLTITDGNAVLTLQSADVDTSAANLLYRVVTQNGGHFESSTGQRVQAFSQADVDAGRVRFLADAADRAVSYQLELRDGTSVVAVIAPTVRYFTTVGSEPGAAPRPVTPAPAPTAQAQTEAPRAVEATPSSGERAPVAMQRMPDFVEPMPAVDYVPTASAAVTLSPQSVARGGDANTAAAAQWGGFEIGFDGDAAAFAPTLSFNLDPQSSASVRQFADELDRMRQQLAGDDEAFSVDAAAATALATGLSAGYVLWLVRGGVLLASLMSSVPAWAAIDPLPILGRMRRQGEGDDLDADHDDDDQIERLFSRARRLQARTGVAPPPAPQPAAAAIAPPLAPALAETIE